MDYRLSPPVPGDRLLCMTKEQAGDAAESRGKQILVGACILAVVPAVVSTFLMGWRFIPGWLGESFGTIAGVMSTPFFMEASFFLLGLVIVIGLNTWRRHKAGDEFVTIETSDAAENAGSNDKSRR